MNKTELVTEIARKAGPGVTPKEITEFLDITVDTIVRAVNKGDSVTVTGFGVFEKRRRAPRMARNPRTGEAVRVKATSVPVFRPAGQFKDILARRHKLPKTGPAVGRGAFSQEPTAVTTPVAKKTATKKAPAKKSAATVRTAAKKAKKAPAAVKKTAASKSAPAAAKKTPAKKVAATKAPAKKAAAKRVRQS